MRNDHYRVREKAKKKKKKKTREMRHEVRFSCMKI